MKSRLYYGVLFLELCAVYALTRFVATEIEAHAHFHLSTIAFGVLYALFSGPVFYFSEQWRRNR